MGCTESSEIINPRGHNHGSFEPLAGTGILDMSLTHGPDSTISQTINSKSKNQFLSKEVIAEQFERVDGNFEQFFRNLSEKISVIYETLSKEVLENMNLNKLDKTQSKVYISEKILLMSLEVIDFVGDKTNYNYDLDIFKKFNVAQRILIGYLKAKYPRGGNSFVPGNLMKVFKEVNVVEYPENDILRNAGISFTNPDDTDIIQNLKLFFNTLIDELNSKFPLFQNLLQEKIFYFQDENNNRKSLNFKIGRKISENTAKYTPSHDQEFSINSPEIFRVIIKWVDDMEDFLLNPEEEVNEKNNFKTYFKEDDKIYFDEVNQDQIQIFHQTLKQKLKELNPAYKAKIKELRKQMDSFNSNLLKILSTTELEQKYVPIHEAKVIKYSMFNTKLVSWMLTEKLIFVLKSLVKVGHKLVFSEFLGKLDLIKFNVTDLMRGMVTGNQKQIMKVYENIKKLESEGEIRIIKIKNRLGTPLNDAMIIFTIKGSFLICELQLILMEGSGVSDKLKNIEFLNHFLYELERSPYGVLSEVAVILGYKDSKVVYEDKIFFKNPEKLSFINCEQKHPTMVKTLKSQNKPFICSQCTQFFHPFENIFDLKLCEECNKYLCCQCEFKNNPSIELREINKRFHEGLSSLIFTEKNKKILPKEFHINLILDQFESEKIFLTKLFKKQFYKIKPQELNKFVKDKDFSKLSPELKKIVEEQYEPFFIILVQFKGEKVLINSFKWVQQIFDFQDPFNEQLQMSSLKRLCSSAYDFILFFKKVALIDVDKKKDKDILLSLHQKQLEKKNNVKTYRCIKVKVPGSEKDINFVLNVQSSKVNKIDGIQIDYNLLASKKDFNYETIEQARESLPNVISLQENFVMKNLGILSSHLSFFQKKENCENIRHLDLSNNKITNINIITSRLSQLETLNASKNFIISVKFQVEYPKMKKLLLFGNKIKKIVNLNNLPALRKMNISENELAELENLTNLKDLKEIICSQNNFKELKWLAESKLEKLESFYAKLLNKNYQNIAEFTLHAKNLKMITITDCVISTVSLDCPELKTLSLTNLDMEKLIINSQSLTQVLINNNKLENMPQILARNLNSLESFQANYCCQKSWIFPKVEAEKLKSLNLSSSYLQNIDNFGSSSLHSLQTLDLTSNLLSKIPELNLPSLQVLKLNQNALNFTKLESSALSKLKELTLSGDSAEYKFPVLKMENLEYLQISDCKFERFHLFSQCRFSNLATFIVARISAKEFPKIELQFLKKMEISNCNFNDLTNFSHLSCHNLHEISIRTLCQELPEAQRPILPRFKTPNLSKLVLSQVEKADIQEIINSVPKLEELEISFCSMNVFPLIDLPSLRVLLFYNITFSETQNLKMINLPKAETFQISGSSGLSKFPKLSFPRLKELNLVQNKIDELVQFDKCDLPELQTLDFSSNSLKEFPVLRFSKLKNLTMYYNPYESFENLSLSFLEGLEYFSISQAKDIKNRVFPKLNLPKIKDLSIEYTAFEDFANLTNSELSSLESLTLAQNRCEILPILNLPKLKELTIRGGYNYEGQEPQIAGESDQAERKFKDVSNLTKSKCPNLTMINIYNTKILKIPYMNFEALEQFYVPNNQIEDVSELEKSNFRSLKAINLSGNKKIEKLPKINNHKLLNTITISHLNLTQINQISSYQVQSIDAIGSNIQKLPEIPNENILNLNLSANKIQQLTPFVYDSFNLVTLDLSENLIQVFPAKKFQNLQVLCLVKNKLKSIRLQREFFPKLKNANISENSLQSLPIIDIQLQELNIFYNQFKEIDFFTKDNDIKITNFYANKNQIQVISHLPLISYLDLSQNKLKDLSFFKHMEKDVFTTIMLNNNQIEDISGLWENKMEFKDLYDLYLANNSIKKFTASKILPNLASLYLEDNQIEEINLNFPILNTLCASRNKIKSLKGIKGKELNYLECTDNLITQVEEDFAINNPLLGTCCLSSNQIEKVADMEARISSMQLNDNKLKKIPRLNLLSAYSYNLSNNPIQDFTGLYNSKISDYCYVVFSFREEETVEKKKEVIQKLKELKIQYECSNEPLENEQNENNGEDGQNAEQDPGENGNLAESEKGAENEKQDQVQVLDPNLVG